MTYGHDYTTLTTFIDAGRKKDRALAHKTRAVRGIDETGAAYVAIRYHRTEVVRFYEDGRTRFDTGGWLTPTTKDRMNYAARFSVWQDHGYWYIRHDHHQAKTHRFTDGITFTKRGRAINAPDPAKDERERKSEERTRRKIRKFAQAAARALAQEARMAHNTGDCWYCLMKTAETGQALGDVTGDFDHLYCHMEEGYYPAALYMNAMEESKNTPVAISMFLHATQDPETNHWMIGGPGTCVDRVEDAVYRYLCRRLLPNRALHGGTRPIGTTHETGMTSQY